MWSAFLFWLGVGGAVAAVLGTAVEVKRQRPAWALTAAGKSLVGRWMIYAAVANLLLLALPGALGYFDVIPLPAAVAAGVLGLFVVVAFFLLQWYVGEQAKLKAQTAVPK